MRCADAGIPHHKRGFATKPTLAIELIDRAVAAQIPAAWVAGDEVYGADPRLRAAIRGPHLGYVMAIAANRRVPTHAGPIRVDALPALIPSYAWQKHSAGAGAHGPRLHSWAWFRLLAEDDTMTHDYKRNGTTTLFAALNVLTGAVIGPYLPRHGRHERFHLHFTPTSSSWLNLVERWFRDLTDKALRHGSFNSVPALVVAIEDYLDAHNGDPKPFVWTATADSILGEVRRGRVTLQAVSQ